MKIIRLLSCIFLYVNATSPFNIRSFVTEYHNEITENGYNFGFVSSDGIRRSEVGQLIPNREGILNVKGDYSYNAPGGTSVSVYYASGTNGYRAKFLINAPQTFYAAAPVPKPISTAAIASLAGGGLG